MQETINYPIYLFEEPILIPKDLEEAKGILMTMYDIRLNLSNQVVSEIRTHFKTIAFETIIPRNVKLSESPSFGLPVISHDADSKGATSYINLAKEILRRNQIKAA